MPLAINSILTLDQTVKSHTGKKGCVVFPDGFTAEIKEEKGVHLITSK